MDAHKNTDKIEQQIQDLDKQRDWIINIHMDPYDDFKINNEK